MGKLKGLLFAGTSSATFGLAPFFTLTLLSLGYSSFEVLSYRWGVATLVLALYGLFSGCNFRVSQNDLATIGVLSLFRAATSLSLVIAYQHIASGIASTIHFMYPLAVTLVMMFFYKEKKSMVMCIAVVVSMIGAVLLSMSNSGHSGHVSVVGIVASCISVFSYAGYIIGVRKSRVVHMHSTVLTCYVMGFGALLFLLGGCLTGGVRLETGGWAWVNILGIALPATALSNIMLVKAIKEIGPTLTSLFGCLEPLTAVLIGSFFLAEPFTLQGAIGIFLVLTSVSWVVFREK